MVLTVCSDSVRFEAWKARTCSVREKNPTLSEGRRKKISVYNPFVWLCVFGIFFFFIFFFLFSYFWKDGEKVTAELQEEGVHRSAVQAAFKATFQDKNIKHNQSNNFLFLLPERPCKISGFRKIEGMAASWTRQNIPHQLPVTTSNSSAMEKEWCTLGEWKYCLIHLEIIFLNLELSFCFSNTKRELLSQLEGWGK